MKRNRRIFFYLCLFIISFNSSANDRLRVLTWDGYITNQDIKSLNKIFKKNKLNLQMKILTPFAEGPKQMFDVIRRGECDVSFLTLFFIKMNENKITRLLEPINTKSKRISNYSKLIPTLKNLEMGMQDGKHLYIPYGAGVYGFYINSNKVAKKDFPKSIKDLWMPKWKGKISLNKNQIWYNIGISLMALDLLPFHLNNLLLKGDRVKAISLASKGGIVQKKVTNLYNQAGNLWRSGTEFNEKLSIVSSWGPEIERRNKSHNENWVKIKFKERDIAWLDTINFTKGIKGKKLIAAELLANYFIGKKPQNRLHKELSMISASMLSRDKNSTTFSPDYFVPPYSLAADNLMQRITIEALKNN